MIRHMTLGRRCALWIAKAALVAGLSAGGALVPSLAGAQTISAMTAAAAAQREPETEAVASPARPTARPAEPEIHSIPVPAVTLYPGDVLTPSMLVNRPFPVHVIDSGGIVASREAMLGKAARRVLPAGKPISINALADVTLVTKGVAARVRMEEHGLIISGFAMPLESGGVGAMIRLKNIDSNQIIVGTIQADGTVRVTIQ